MRVVTMKHFAKLVVEAGSSEVLARTALALLTFGFLGSVAVLPNYQILLFSLAATFFAIFITTECRRAWENRYENYKIVSQRVRLHVMDHGRKLEYSTFMKVRSTQKNLAAVYTRCAWSGETDLMSDGVITSLSSPDVEVEPRVKEGYVEIKFGFKQSLRRFKTATVAVKLTLIEPNLSYARFIGKDASNFAWSSTSKLIREITWDDTRPVDIDSIRGMTLRSRWDRHRRSKAAYTIWESSDMKPLKSDYNSNPPGRRWEIIPVRRDRYYLLEYELADRS